MATAVAKWTVKGQEIFLSREDDRLIMKQESREALTVSGILCRKIEDEICIIKRFYPLIQANLEEKVCALSICPILYTKVHSLQDGQLIPSATLRVALFVQKELLDTPLPAYKYKPYFGIYDKTTKKVTGCKVDSEEISRFILEFQSKATTAEKNIYAKDFVVVLEFSRTGDRESIQSIELVRHRSLYNRDIVLTERCWAVTVISKQATKKSRKYICVGGPKESGHAMIACEGVSRGRRFLSYAHITILKDPAGRDSDRSENEARVEVRDRETPFANALNGPTWSRSKNFVEQMLHNIKRAEEDHEYVKFSRLSSPAQGVLGPLSLGGCILSIPLMFLVPPVGYALGLGSWTSFLAMGGLSEEGRPWNCTIWVLYQLARNKIFTPDLHPSLTSPNSLISHLQSHPIDLTTDRTFEHALFQTIPTRLSELRESEARVRAPDLEYFLSTT